MTESTRKLKIVKIEDIEPSMTTKSVMTVDGPETLERAAFMLHTAMTFNLKRYLDVEALASEYPWAALTWREIKTNPAHRWIYEWFMRTADDFASYLDDMR